MIINHSWLTLIYQDRALQLLEAERKAMQERLKAAEDAVRIAKEEEEIRLRQSVSPTVWKTINNLTYLKNEKS